ncbi:MAG: O-methyltransferase, partial [Candidatus Bathyarchaeia archaeon]
MSFLPILGPVKGRVLVDLIRERKPKRVLEIGTLVGYSAILMGKELESGAELITLEIDPNVAERAKENIQRAGLAATIMVLVGDARELLPSLPGTFDLVFVDAEKEQYLEYLKLLESKLHPGSVVVADNATHAPEYLAYVRGSGKYISQFIPGSGGGMEVSIRQ